MLSFIELTDMRDIRSFKNPFFYKLNNIASAYTYTIAGKELYVHKI